MIISAFLKRSSPILKVSALASVLVFVMILGYNSIGSSSPTRRAGSVHDTPSAMAGCSHVDDSFCQTEHDFKQYVAAQAIADLLEHQAATTITCDGHQEVKAYCGDTVSGLRIHISSVIQSGNPMLLVRNDYIKLLRNYFSQHGPFSYSATERTGSGITMMFSGRSTELNLSLQFQHQGSAWQFITPVIGGQ